MPVFPARTPDAIVFGAFFILAGWFFLDIFEFSPPLLKEAPKASLVLGAVLLVAGMGRLAMRRRTDGAAGNTDKEK